MVGTHTSQHVPPGSASPTVAVVGSGPSGCYVAQFLSKTWPDSEITVFESLPAPYGLIRYGVAADHQGTKGVVRQFDRLFTRGGIRFAGNVTVGRDIDFARLADSFDIVVLATGLPGDRELDVPRDPRARVVGAGALLRALNGFPHHGLPRTPLGSRVLVIGMGNVALDVLRLLSKDTADFTGSDIDDEMLTQLRPERPATLDVIARSGASQAKCDAAMLRELIALDGVDIAVSGLDEKDSGPVADLLRAAAVPARDEPGRTRVTFHFGLVPESLTTCHGRTVLTARRRDDGGSAEFAADTVVTAIGFTHGAAHDDCCPGPDWTGDHVYRAGWLSRGAQGTIAENRKHAQSLVRSIVDDFAAGRITADRPGFAGVADLLAHRVVGFGDWQRIEAAEHRSARPGRCRRKITDLDQMLALATGAR
ncbi:pyridine nucleotide-disulfide oxidoreductase [Amycolatopsis deserti]|uniref:Pyridine nucleotide-disulfide oxidoreductase n=1 Tax=Amycolatopsis deserti TaxID=185696 RepID=A0ABQ3IF91_9PSEU|nr:NAD(P)-binding protein [Amycolatopsis deserti]GHE76463.1 pyridine nucleotide-disulfide oxidoreductase [Amycolatopsis deserti]